MNLAAASVLFFLPWAVALVKVRHYHLDSGAVSLAATFSLGLPPLWLAVAGYLEARKPEKASELTMAHVADQLAVAVGSQWRKEDAVRRLNDPRPLPVSWVAADASLTDTWDSLVRLAASAATWPPLQPAGTWATGPDDLAGKDRELVDVLARVPTGRLVVLGEPGAGKTMLMVRLVPDLLARRADGEPVPILASVASWDPANQDLRDWLSAQLLAEHPDLADPPAVGMQESTQAAALLARGLILPILDGLDEIPEQVRGPAISRINDALQPGERLVVTCRTQQYQDAVRPLGGVEVTLRGAAAIQLRPLDADAVRHYLCDSAPGPVTRARWAPVLAVLGTETPAGQALRTPLMVGLACAIYNPAGARRDPAELCDFADRSRVEAHLFDAFIPAAYRHDSACRWKAQDAERWLVFLARHLERKVASPDLAWWQLRLAVPPTARGLASNLRYGLAAGIAFGAGFGLAGGFGFPLTGRFAFGAGFGLVGWVPSEPSEKSRELTKAPSRRIRISVRGLGAGLGAGLGLGLILGFPVGLAGMLCVLLVSKLAGTPLGGFWDGPGAWAAGLGFCLASANLGVFSALEAVPGDLAAASSPQAVLTRDRRAAFLLTLGAGVLFGVGFGLAGELGFGLAGGLGFGLAGGLIGGFYATWALTAWPSYMATVGWLAFGHRLPWSLMSFLADAHQRGILRQAGTVYQFRHIDLQRRLAWREDAGLIVAITCPGCKFQQQVPEGVLKANCPNCGKEIRFARCNMTNKNVRVLSEWSKFTHPGCKIEHYLK